MCALREQGGNGEIEMNRITLIGYLGQDAEQRTTRGNVAFTVLSLATRKSWKDRDGERQSRMSGIAASSGRINWRRSQPGFARAHTFNSKANS
jgi:single-stranded DNA-binding protein